MAKSASPMTKTAPTSNGRQSASKAGDPAFLSDVKTLRQRARKHIEEGAVTEGYELDKTVAVKILNEALATELVCILRYKRHYYMATGFRGTTAAAEFLEHANEEQQHADQIALRITQLMGEPNFNPEGLTSRSHAEYVEGHTLEDMIREDLIAERIAIDSYREMIQFFGDKDSTTRVMLEGILAVEEEHANDMIQLLEESQ